jgi:hypothetical protein
MDVIENVYRDKNDVRIILVVWRVEQRRFELWFTDTSKLLQPMRLLKVFPRKNEFGDMRDWNRAKAQANTWARGLSFMDDEQFSAMLASEDNPYDIVQGRDSTKTLLGK